MEDVWLTKRRDAAQRYLQDHEHDACALVARVAADGRPAHATLTGVVSAMVQMQHRTGDVGGEGDGCGVLTDIPRAIWERHLDRRGLRGGLAHAKNFCVAHIFIPRAEPAQAKSLKQRTLRIMQDQGIEILAAMPAVVNSAALGPRGRADEPEFWQVAGLVHGHAPTGIDARLYHVQLKIEAEAPVHFVSFSTHSAVYKVRGAASMLLDYFPELKDPAFATVSAIGHNRYSTNTSTIFERVQPFALLGHNGEINTVRQLQEQAKMLAIPLLPGASDSQDVSRVLQGLLYQYDLSLFEAVEMLFPPIINEIKQYPGELQDLYMYLRQVWGPYCQGPAAMVLRAGNQLVGSVDAMGLRPLWLLQTADAYTLSSEQGVVPLGEQVAEPRPLAPGEKVALVWGEGRPTRLFTHAKLQQEVLRLSAARVGVPTGYRQFLNFALPMGAELEEAPRAARQSAAEQASLERWLAALAWEDDDIDLVQAIAAKGIEPIGSLGYDGPLAALSPERVNLADFFKESVAVVTNPAIDREREIEHFSTRVVIGCRPPLDRPDVESPSRLELRLPVLLGGHKGAAPLPPAAYRGVAGAHGTMLFEDLVAAFTHGDAGAVYHLHSVFTPPERLAEALDRLQTAAIGAALTGVQLIVIDDAHAFDNGCHWIDPHLVLAAVDTALKRQPVPPGQQNLRRRVSLILRSGSLRNLHDIVFALGLGADALVPYAMAEVAAADPIRFGNRSGATEHDPRGALDNLLSGLVKGLEKVISTLGIHELRGYGRLFSSIGLGPALQDLFATANYAGSRRAGVDLERLEEESLQRYRIARGDAPARIARSFRLYPRIYKAAIDVATGRAPYSAYGERLAQFEREHPVALRHLLDVRTDPAGGLDPSRVDTSVGSHSYPFLISSMSFGSQGETAFRAYPEAARRLNIYCLNGEGGEIPDLIGKYPRWRGQQVASGRFGVQANMINSSELVEIKIGQGAKPGEGGHLPGSKVSHKVAQARSAAQGIDLISPSNNHDIYSIEDLAQIVEELKTVNPRVRVSVKVPCVPGIGTIAVGIAKSGADIITLSGYDGGTGAARRHALRYAGLPADIGVKEAHMALVAAGIRDRMEIWADGGMKSAADVVKMICLGANRVGFGTLAMVAIGCTICRGCQLDTCHVGIATQVETLEEAVKKNMKRFEPRQWEQAVEHLVRFFGALGEEVRRLTALMGFSRTQDLVGRSDLLQQARLTHRVDLSEFLLPEPGWEPEKVQVAAPLGDPFAPLPPPQGRAQVRVVPNPLTEQLARDAVGRFLQGEEEWQATLRQATPKDRILGTYLAGALFRGRHSGSLNGHTARLHIAGEATPGNGLGAFSLPGMEIRVEGGAQDGVGKGSFGGRVVILKGQGKHGRLGGAVGKSVLYGAIRGLFLIQGMADARACIRLSGADVVFGAEPAEPVSEGGGNAADRAQLKGFAFEYMTNGRAVVLGDPGPWACSGMTGGVVYLRHWPEMGLTDTVLKRRIAKGAKVYLSPIGRRGRRDLEELLGAYIEELRASGQADEAARIAALLADPEQHFRAVIPVNQQMDPDISTE